MKKLLLILTCLLTIANVGGAAAKGGGGRLDPSFGEGGRVVRALQPGLTGGTEAAQAPDGEIYALCRGELFALRPDGRADPGFGQGGTVTLGAALPEVANPRFAVDPQGRVVVAGTDEIPEGNDQERLALARLLPNGNRDPSFGSNGLVITDLGLGLSVDEQPELVPLPPPGVYVRQQAIAVDPFGRLVVTLSHVTRFERYVARDTNVLVERSEKLFARFNPDGELDTSYGEGGIATSFSFEYGDSVPAPDGSIYEISRFGENGLFATHLDPDGHLDPGFGSGGWRKLPDKGRTSLIPDGRHGLVVLRADGGSPGREISVRRLLPDGRLDRRFGKRGVFRAKFGAGYEMPVAAPDHQGGLFLAAQWARRKSETSRARRGFLLVHLAPRGELDRRFGRIKTGFGHDSIASVSSLWVDRHGRPLIAGQVGSPLLDNRSGIAVARYRAPR